MGSILLIFLKNTVFICLFFSRKVKNGRHLWKLSFSYEVMGGNILFSHHFQAWLLPIGMNKFLSTQFYFEHLVGRKNRENPGVIFSELVVE